jgi:hypothetical protein
MKAVDAFRAICDVLQQLPLDARGRVMSAVAAIQPALPEIAALPSPPEPGREGSERDVQGETG